ncbi:hypothetical protein HAX54_032664, partial [Datura stramonium]|nr:hypothetical protein [Datura stramonium]
DSSLIQLSIATPEAALQVAVTILVLAFCDSLCIEGTTPSEGGSGYHLCRALLGFLSHGSFPGVLFSIESSTVK